MCKKSKTRKFCDSPELLDDIALKDEFKHLLLKQQFTYEMQVNAALASSPYLYDELISLVNGPHQDTAYLSYMKHELNGVTGLYLISSPNHLSWTLVTRATFRWH